MRSQSEVTRSSASCVTPPPRPDEVQWDPARGRLDETALDGVDAVVNLAGVGIGDRRWNAEHKREVERVAHRRAPARSRRPWSRTVDRTGAAIRLVNASAVGYYGDRGEEHLTETSAPGQDFLSRRRRALGGRGAAGGRCRAPRGVRPHRLVMARRAARSKQVVLLGRLGLGGPMASGREWWPWITLVDEVRAILHLIDRPELAGPFNLAAPGSARQREIASAIGSALSRPAFVPAPHFALRAVIGEFADSRHRQPTGRARGAAGLRVHLRAPRPRGRGQVAGAALIALIRHPCAPRTMRKSSRRPTSAALSTRAPVDVTTTYAVQSTRARTTASEGEPDTNRASATSSRSPSHRMRAPTSPETRARSLARLGEPGAWTSASAAWSRATSATARRSLRACSSSSVRAAGLVASWSTRPSALGAGGAGGDTTGAGGAPGPVAPRVATGLSGLRQVPSGLRRGARRARVPPAPSRLRPAAEPRRRPRRRAVGASAAVEAG